MPNDTTTNWKKQGTFKKKDKNSFRDTLTYENTSASVLHKIEIECNNSYVSGLGKAYQFRIYIKEVPYCQVQLNDTSLTKHMPLEHLVAVTSEEEERGNDYRLYYIKDKNHRSDLLYILELLRKYEKSIDDDLFENLLSELEIKKPQQYFREKIFELISKNKTEEAVALAIAMQKENSEYEVCYDVIWELAVQLKNDLFSSNTNILFINAQQVYDLFANIIKENPHFSAANAHLLDIMENHTESSGNDKHRLDRLKFKLAVNSGNQQKVDKYFDLLCGHDGLAPRMVNIKGDIFTLFALADEIKRQTIEIKELKSQIKQMDLQPKTNKTKFWTSENIIKSDNARSSGSTLVSKTATL